MPDLKFIRCKNIMRDAETKIDTTYRSINGAKRFSRRVQMAENGALGRGAVMVVDKLPPLVDANQ